MASPLAAGPRPTGAARSAAPHLVVLGHVNLDILLQVKELPTAGASVPILERRTAWGGTAGNIARHAGGLGVPTRLWSRVGADFPPAWRAAYEADGVDLAFFETDHKGRTPTCFVLTDLAERQCYAVDQGAMARMADDPPSPALLNGLPEGSWLHFATGDPLAYAPLAAAAKAAGYHVALDPGQELRFMYDERSLRGMLAFSDLFFCNEFELGIASALLGAIGPDALLEHVPNVVVTRGAKGASLHRRGHQAVTRPAFPATVVDPTGAGDALRAGFHAALLAGKGMEAALRWGQAAASVCVAHVGAQEHVVRQADLEAAFAAER